MSIDLSWPAEEVVSWFKIALSSFAVALRRDSSVSRYNPTDTSKQRIGYHMECLVRVGISNHIPPPPEPRLKHSNFADNGTVCDVMENGHFHFH